MESGFWWEHEGRHMMMKESSMTNATIFRFTLGLLNDLPMPGMAGELLRGKAITAAMWMNIPGHIHFKCICLDAASTRLCSISLVGVQ